MTRITSFCLLLLLFSPTHLNSAQDNAVTTDPLIPSPEFISYQGFFPEYGVHNSAALLSLAENGVRSIHLQICMTRDGHLILFPSITIEKALIPPQFKDRNREDGNYYLIDFSLGELQDIETGSRLLPLLTLKQAFALSSVLQKTYNKTFHFYLELKNISFHLQEGFDIFSETMDVISTMGGASERFYILASEAGQLKRVFSEGLSRYPVEIKLCLMVEEGSFGIAQEDQGWIFTRFGLRSLSYFVDTIFLSRPVIQKNLSSEEENTFLENAHKLGLRVFYKIEEIEENQEVKDDSAKEYDQLESLLFSQKTAGILTPFSPEIYDHIKELTEDKKQKQEQEKNSIHKRLPHLFSIKKEPNSPLFPNKDSL